MILAVKFRMVWMMMQRERDDLMLLLSFDKSSWSPSIGWHTSIFDDFQFQLIFASCTVAITTVELLSISTLLNWIKFSVEFMGLIQHDCGNLFLVFFSFSFGRRVTYDLRDQTNIHPNTKQSDEILKEQHFFFAAVTCTGWGTSAMWLCGHPPIFFSFYRLNISNEWLADHKVVQLNPRKSRMNKNCVANFIVLWIYLLIFDRRGKICVNQKILNEIVNDALKCKLLKKAKKDENVSIVDIKW